MSSSALSGNRTDVPGRGSASARLWTVEDVAEYLAVPVRTIYRWRAHGYGPPGRRVGKYVRYRPQDVTAWFDQITDPAT
jgi:excisionase family DNA binding protein